MFVNYFKQTIGIVNKIKELLTEDAICMIMDKYTEILSKDKIELIEKYLFSKVQLLKEVYAEVDYES